MARSYKGPSGRIQRRRSNGRFRKTTLRDFGIQDSDMAPSGEYRCFDCGHQWQPIMRTGIGNHECPKCDSENITTPYTREKTDEMEGR